MNYTDEIFKELLKLQDVINKIHFGENDVRKYYFGMLKSILLGYYHGYLSFETGNKILINQSMLEALKFNPNQLQLLTQAFSSENSNHTYFSHHHRNLIISSWSAFETLVTTVCETILPSEIKTELLSFQYDEIKKKFKLEENGEMRKKFSINHLTHVPMPRKCNKLFSFLENYSGSRKEDKRFLSLFGDFRNTIHTNFIYYGSKTNEYQFGETKFIFTPNKVVRYSFNSSTPYSPLVYLNLVNNLIAISAKIIFAINFPNEIPYSDLNAMK
ncbi:MAG: hypothetical protein EAZ41_00580 [Sphingobacteriia bacterium]|nr:MAG: hypothetical protein EAZ41_00580 [Sphingobacteriia bacterium]